MPSAWGRQSKYGDYEIAGASQNAPRLLGEGGFGKTYEAVRTELVGGSAIEERVAVKVLNPELLTSESKRRQFLAELFALTKFQHPNLIQYVSCGEQNGEVYYAMELCRGGDLLGMVRRFGPLPERAAAQITLQVATGLKQVHHKHGLVHRDIKPSNIMLAEELSSDLSREHMELRFEQQESLCRVVDFGLVDFALKAEKTPQRFVGTPMYASPEQIRGGQADARSDIYSLGMTVWFLVQAKGPLLDEDAREVKSIDAAMLRHTSPEEHELPRHLSKVFRAVLARMVAKNPGERFAGAAELQAALRDYLSQPEDTGEMKFPLTRHGQALETLFDLGPRLYARGGQPAYLAKERASGRAVKLCVAANATGAEAQMETLAQRLCKLAEVSYEPLLPPALAPVRAVILAEDLLAYAEDAPLPIALPDLLKTRSAAGRAIPFAEAVVLFQPIAQGLDFLLARARETVSLSIDQVTLGGPTASCHPSEPEVLQIPLTEWNGLRIRFGLMPPPELPNQKASDADSPGGSTVAGSMQLDAEDAHPLPSFARLIYRVLAGAEAPAIVRLAPDAYIPTMALSPASNHLLRDNLSRRRQWASASDFLRDLCAAESVPMHGPTPTAIARVVAPGRVRTPYAPAGTTQQLPEAQWQPGREFVCSVSHRRVTLPDELPPWQEPVAPVEVHSAPAPRPVAKPHESAEEYVESLQQTVIAPRGDAPSAREVTISRAAQKSPVSIEPKPQSGRHHLALICSVIAALAIAGGGVVWKMRETRPEPNGFSPQDEAFAGKTPGEVRVIAGIPFRWCPATGTQGFIMGSPDTEIGREADETRHPVMLTRGFWLAETEVTQGQWKTLAGVTQHQQAEKAFADNTPYGLPGKRQTIRERFGYKSADQMVALENPRAPVYWVNWDEASGACEQATKSEHTSGRLPAGWAITLPSEAQWEYACRAGTVSATYAGNLNPLRDSAPILSAPVLDAIVWYGANSGTGYPGKGFEPGKWAERDYHFSAAGPRLTGEKIANAWNLRDMLGNVGEWCEDWYAGFSGSPEKDPLGPAQGLLRVQRGGSWISMAASCRAAARFRAGPHLRMRNVGFRPAVIVVSSRAAGASRSAGTGTEAAPSEADGGGRE